MPIPYFINRRIAKLKLRSAHIRNYFGDQWNTYSDLKLKESSNKTLESHKVESIIKGILFQIKSFIPGTDAYSGRRAIIDQLDENEAGIKSVKKDSSNKTLESHQIEMSQKTNIFNKATQRFFHHWSTKGILFQIKSFIPGTDAYSERRTIIDQLDENEAGIKSVEQDIIEKNVALVNMVGKQAATTIIKMSRANSSITKLNAERQINYLVLPSAQKQTGSQEFNSLVNLSKSLAQVENTRFRPASKNKPTGINFNQLKADFATVPQFQYYFSKTQSLWGKISVNIPFTDAYNARKALDQYCAKADRFATVTINRIDTYLASPNGRPHSEDLNNENQELNKFNNVTKPAIQKALRQKDIILTAFTPLFEQVLSNKASPSDWEKLLEWWKLLLNFRNTMTQSVEKNKKFLSPQEITDINTAISNISLKINEVIVAICKQAEIVLAEKRQYEEKVTQSTENNNSTKVSTSSPRSELASSQDSNIDDKLENILGCASAYLRLLNQLPEAVDLPHKQEINVNKSLLKELISSLKDSSINLIEKERQSIITEFARIISEDPYFAKITSVALNAQLEKLNGEALRIAAKNNIEISSVGAEPRLVQQELIAAFDTYINKNSLSQKVNHEIVVMQNHLKSNTLLASYIINLVDNKEREPSASSPFSSPARLLPVGKSPQQSWLEIEKLVNKAKFILINKIKHTRSSEQISSDKKIDVKIEQFSFLYEQLLSLKNILDLVLSNATAEIKEAAQRLRAQIAADSRTQELPIASLIGDISPEDTQRAPSPADSPRDIDKIKQDNNREPLAYRPDRSVVV